MIRVILRADNIVIKDTAVPGKVGDILSGNGFRVGYLVLQRFESAHDPAGKIKVFHEKFSAGKQAADMRSFFSYGIKYVHR